MATRRCRAAAMTWGTQLEATVMRCANLRKVHALVGRRSFPAMLAPAAGVARREPDQGSIDRGRCGDAGGPGATLLPKKPTAAAARLRDRRRSAASCVKSPGRDPG